MTLLFRFFRLFVWRMPVLIFIIPIPHFTGKWRTYPAVKSPHFLWRKTVYCIKICFLLRLCWFSVWNIASFDKQRMSVSASHPYVKKTARCQNQTVFADYLDVTSKQYPTSRIQRITNGSSWDTVFNFFRKLQRWNRIIFSFPAGLPPHTFS